jgi:hypothetical protein
MKYKDGNYVQLGRELYGYKLSDHAKWLYTVLVEMEHRYTDGDGRKDFFWRTEEELAADCGRTAKSIRKYRRELEKAGLIECWKYHPPVNGNGCLKGPCRKAAVMAFRLKR